MTLGTNITDFTTAVGADIKLLHTLLNGKAADLAALTTVDKSTIVAALNEVKLLAEGASGGGYSDAQADARVQAAKGSIASPGTDEWATTQDVATELAAAVAAATSNAVDQITNGAGAAYDTLVEIQTLLQSNDGAVSGIIAAQAKRVAVNAAQTFTTAEKLQGCQNLGIGDPETDFLAAYTAARDS